MHRRLFTKLWAMLLVMALLLQVPAMAAFADEVTSEDVTLTVMESEAVSESETETENEPASVTETDFTEETEAADEAETEAVPETDAVLETEAVTEEVPETETSVETETESETETGTETETETETEKAEIKKITAFQEIPEKDKMYAFAYDDKPTQAELQSYLPKTLMVRLEGESSPQAIEVSWEGPTDYEDSKYFYYAFTPTWDETLYEADPAAEVPYVWVVFSSSLLDAPVTDSANESKVYKYLVTKAPAGLGFNKAAALGIMANIEVESDFDPDLHEVGGSGYGLLQWSFDRKTELRSYLNKKGYAEDSIEGQLQFMMEELKTDYYKHILTKLQSVSNTANGAYEAAYYFCYHFEIPYDKEGQSAARGAWARDRYWPLYSGSQAVVDQGISISGHTVPGDTLNVGDFFNIRGTVSSANKLTSVTVGVYNAAGTRAIGRSVTPNTTSYNLINVDSLIKFGTLKPGIYRYKVVASDSKGTSTLVNKVFTVLADSRTVSDGTYEIVVSSNTAFGLYVGGRLKTNGANIYLGKTSIKTDFMKFVVTHKNGGYYSVKNVGSGKYLTVSGQSSASGTNVYQHYTGTLWQILPDSKGGYYLVPKCAPSCSLYVQGGKAALRQNVQIATSKMAAMQSFKLLAPGATAKPTITGQTVPGTLTTGDKFTVRGVVKSASNITSVAVGVYDSSGKMIIGRSAAPGTASYNLNNLDAQLKFGSIRAGVYTYRVVVKNALGATTLVDHTFAVLSKERTVSDGTFYIVLKSNNKLGFAVAKNSKAEYANVNLWTLSSTNMFQRYKLAYQSNGYYKIQNVGSGKYVGIEGQSSKSGANVRLSTAGTLFQILPDGGAYRIVPKCATNCALTVTGNKFVNGCNIRMFKHTNVAKQRLAFKNVTTAAKATISGQTAPGDMYVGTPFSIRGVISSTTNLTKVTVGVYNSAGANVIGRTVTPNAKTYDLINVDSLIKFGTLAAGTYRYRVTATNAAGTVTLVNKQFVVKP